jgi:hypothetical protein
MGFLLPVRIPILELKRSLVTFYIRCLVVATRSNSMAKAFCAFIGLPLVLAFKLFLLRPRYIEMDLAVPAPESTAGLEKVVDNNYVFQHPALDTTKNPFYICCYTKEQLEDVQPFWAKLAGNPSVVR